MSRTPAQMRACLECKRGTTRIIRGRCTNCYDRWRDSSDWKPLPKPTWQERLFSRLIIDPSGCLLWTGARTPLGYGHMAVDGHYVGVHTLTYKLFCGPIQDRYDIDHLCRIPPCAAPAHLEAVPHRINCLRGISPIALRAGNTHCPQNHEYTPANTYVDRKGKRHCRTCNIAKCRQWRLTGSMVGFASLFAADGSGEFRTLMDSDTQVGLIPVIKDEHGLVAAFADQESGQRALERGESK
jgi:hypothetical protein